MTFDTKYKYLFTLKINHLNVNSQHLLHILT